MGVQHFTVAHRGTRRRSTRSRRWLVAALGIGTTVLLTACDSDSDNSNIDPIPSDNSVVNSGLPTTDGSTITTPAPNPDAGGGSGSGTSP